MRWLTYSAIVCAAGVAALIAGPLQAADHREAPLIQADPQADLGDVYAFRNPNDLSKLVMIMTVNPLSVPSENTTYRFSPDVQYTFKIDNDGDAIADRFVFIRFGPLGATQTVHANLPGNFQISGDTTAPTANVEPNEPIIIEGPAGSGIRLFAGQTDDPFFFDIAGFFRTLSGTGTFNGTDGFAGTNVSSIVVELPLTLVSGGNNQLQIWGETARRQNRQINPTGVNLQVESGAFARVDRTGIPAVSSALIPTGRKDRYNYGVPRNDAAQFAADIVETLTNTFGTNDENIGILAPVAIPDTLKLDVSQPDGFPNGRTLDDDVIDTLLFFIFNQTPVSDGVDANDVPFRDVFPFVGAPHQPPG